jgi:hypothetical protein
MQKERVYRELPEALPSPAGHWAGGGGSGDKLVKPPEDPKEPQQKPLGPRQLPPQAGGDHCTPSRPWGVASG